MAENKIEPKVIIYHKNSKGIPIIFLPGLNMKPKDYSRYLENLNSKRIYAISPHESKPKIKSIEDYINLIQKTIKIKRIKKFDLIGHSLGGGTALKSTKLKPRRIVAINPLLELEGKIPLYIRKFSRIPAHKFRKRFFFYIAFLNRYILNFRAINKLIKDIENFKLEKISAPTLILLAEGDELFSEKNIPKEKFKKLELIKTKGRHFNLINFPKEINEKTLDFLK